MQRMRASAVGLVSFMKRLTSKKYGLAPWELWELCLRKNWDRIVAAIRACIALLVMVRPVADKDLPERLQENARKARAFATSKGYPANGYLWWLVQPGLWLRQHVPQFGQCLEAWAYMAGWDIKNDEPTGSWLVCWIPLWLEESTNKTVDQQVSWMAAMRQEAGLPEHYFSGFGSGVLLGLLMLCYKKLTGKEVVPRDKAIRTDTRLSDGYRFYLRFSPQGLDGCSWYWCGDADSDVGCLLLGVEVLGPSDTGFYTEPTSEKIAA